MPARGQVAVALAAVVGLVGATDAVSADVAIPAPLSGETQGAQLPPPTPSPPVAPQPPTTPEMVRALRVGSRGAAVRDLQRELRRRGARIAVDGAFGPATKQAVKWIQRRLGLPRTGVADAKLIARLGLRVRSTAGARAVVRPTRGQYVQVFPVAGPHSYSDDWGAPRAQGRHEGTDIMADRHTPLVAADTGVISKISRTETGLGGIYLWIRRPDGIQFYYAHMQSIAEGLELGSAVTAGQVVGTVGNSGDARYGATHVHFEIRRDWTPFNPYPELLGVDPDQAR